MHFPLAFETYRLPFRNGFRFNRIGWLGLGLQLGLTWHAETAGRASGWVIALRLCARAPNGHCPAHTAHTVSFLPTRRYAIFLQLSADPPVRVLGSL